MALALVSLGMSIIALAVNASGLVRRPHIRAEWGPVRDNPPLEGLAITVTAGRRPIEVEELGLVRLTKRARRRTLAEWIHEDRPIRYAFPVTGLPRRLQDGESTRGFVDLDTAQEELGVGSRNVYPYVMGGGKVYLPRDSPHLHRLRRRIGRSA